MVRPDSKEPRWLAYNPDMERGNAGVRIPLALDEPTGEWTLRLTDVATQTTAEARFTVQ